MLLLSTLFLVTATLYSSVGFGGGSTYLALLLISGVPYFIFPVIALTCNIIVVSGNCLNYIRAGNLNFKLLIPYLLGSIPLAFIGGSLHIEKNLFEIFLRIDLRLEACTPEYSALPILSPKLAASMISKSVCFDTSFIACRCTAENMHP